MPRMHHRVILSAADRAHLHGILRRGTASAFTQRRARVLLKTDRTRSPRLTDVQVAEACEVSPRLVARARADWGQRGLGSLQLPVRPRPPVPARLDGAAEARVGVLACSTPPAGHARWSLRLLAERVVELEITDAISYETVRRILKKTRSSPGSAPAT